MRTGRRALPAITTTDLDLVYSDTGDPGAPAVLLLHGWPDDATAWDRAAAAAVAAGFRVLVPSLRGFGATRFREAAAPRTGNIGVHALDMIEVLDALGLDRVLVAGHDWGAGIGVAMAVGWPDRVGRLALLSVPPQLGGTRTPPYWKAHVFWYQWFLATRRGADAVRADPMGFARYQWETWSPPGWFDEATFDQVARSWDNPDFVDVTIHSYRSRWDEAQPDPRSAWLEERVARATGLSLPSLYIQGEQDGVNPPAATADVGATFSGPFARLVLPGVGHFPAREAPDAVAAELVAFFRGEKP